MSKIRDFLKNNWYKFLIFDSYFHDAVSFSKNYALSSNGYQNIEYRMLIISHSIEKGLSSINIRRFGFDKVKNLINLLTIYLNSGYPKRYSFNQAMSVLKKYLEVYEENGWKNTDEYVYVENFLNKKEFEYLPAGSTKIMKKDFEKSSKVNYADFCNGRFSVRSFSDKKVDIDTIRDAIKVALKTPNACNRQMTKVYLYKSNSDIEYITSFSQGISGFDTTNINYLVVTFEQNAFLIPGDRNQGYFNSGLFTTNLINYFHSVGIGSCCIGFSKRYSEEKVIKKRLRISPSEKISVVLAFGYYNEEYKVPCSVRKNVEEIFSIME